MVRITWISGRTHRVEVSLERARHVIPFGSPGTLSIVAEGRVVRTYDDLCEVAAEGAGEGREVLEVTVLAPLAGG